MRREALDRKKEILRQIKAAMESGKYPVAGLYLFDTVDRIKMSDYLENHLEYTEEIMNAYLYEISELNDKNPGLKEYLKTIKLQDIKTNHCLEKENSFLVDMYMQLPQETAIDKLIKYANKEKNITQKDIFKIHHALLYGTQAENDTSIRTSNEKFVGELSSTGERIIHYFPIDYHDVKNAAKKLAELYNIRLSNEVFDNVFMQPFLIHGLLGALQMFTDGNTRMGRVMQHALMWQLINEKTDFNFELPPIYVTPSYYPHRDEYRKLIANICKQNDSEAWNKWFDFNLYRLEDQIYTARENVKTLNLHNMK